MFEKRCVALTLAIAMLSTQTQAAMMTPPPAASTSWQYGATLYLWGAAISGTTANGNDFDVPFKTILKHLDMGFMCAFEARYDRWSLLADVMYLKVSADRSRTATLSILNQTVDIDIDTNVKMKSWIVTPGIGYRLIDRQEGNFDIIAGGRYLSIGIAGSGEVWDGIGGIKGRINLTENWYLPYLADIGAGDSKLTREALGGIAYHFSCADLMLAYRYLDWRFHSNVLLDKLNLSGPILGARFVF